MDKSDNPQNALGYEQKELTGVVKTLLDDQYATKEHEHVTLLAHILEEMFPEGIWDDDVDTTAWRIIKYWREYRGEEHVKFKPTVFEAVANQLIVVNNIEFSSTCAHHLLPFFGIAHVGYIPNRKMIGLSKIPRIVDHFAKRPQVQERLTAQIAAYLKDLLSAHGVAVVIAARHTCMACRGVRQHNGHMTTSEMRGVFLTSSSARAEFMEMIKTEVAL